MIGWIGSGKWMDRRFEGWIAARRRRPQKRYRKQKKQKTSCDGKSAQLAEAALINKKEVAQ